MYNSIIILGPTASGKTDISINLAKQLNSEIINADCMQIYKELDIGTAKASIEEQDGIKHHLLDFVEPTKEFSVSEYRDLALPIIANLITDLISRFIKILIANIKSFQSLFIQNS